jgi:hypothetical protein
MLGCCQVGKLGASYTIPKIASLLTATMSRFVGFPLFFGRAIIFVSPIAVVALPLSGDQIVPVRFPEWRKVLRGSPALAPGVCAKGVPSLLTPYVHL